MHRTDPLFLTRKTLDEICTVPDKIISVYSLEKHVWANANSKKAIKKRKPELKTVEEFQIDPVRPFLTDVLRNMAAPYKPNQKENPIGQGYWIQAEFGSGKSHVLCFLAALALGDEKAWEIVRKKERNPAGENGKRSGVSGKMGLKQKAEKAGASLSLSPRWWGQAAELSDCTTKAGV